LLGAGLLAAALTGLSGLAVERWWLGSTDAAAAARVESLVRREFDGMTAALTAVATRIASDPAARDQAAQLETARALFELVANARLASPHPDDIAVTVYDAVRSEASAWSGRPSDIPPDRVVGPQQLFLTRTALGLRLVLVQPIVGTEGDTNGRLGAVGAEHVLSRAPAGAAIAAADDLLPTSIAPVSLRIEGAGDKPRDGAFLLRTPTGGTLVEGYVAPADLQKARAGWRRSVLGWVIVVLGVTQLLLIGPLLDARSRTGAPATVIAATLAASLLLAGGAAAVWWGITWSAGGRSGLPLNLSFSSISLAALAALWTSPATVLHTAVHPRRTPSDGLVRFGVLNLLAGVVMAGLLLVFARVLAMAVDPATVDVRHFSLYPWNGARVLRLAGMLALHVAALWTATLVLIAARGVWRLPSRTLGVRLALLALWVTPTVVAGFIAARIGWLLPVVGLLLSAIACAVAALLARRVLIWYRHATIAARIFGLFVTFLVPAVLLYPALNFFAELAVQRLITTYAVEAQNHSSTMLDRLREAQREIDALTGLAGLVSESDCSAPPDPKNAFFVWSQTVFARDRLTSAVELYDRRCPQVVSRFALNLPEYTGSGRQPQAVSSCQWDVFGEPLPIGSQKRLVLHAERGICDGRDDGIRPSVGTIVLHLAVDDYRTLPFITSQSPYFELFRPSQTEAAREAAPGNDVHVAIYGWGLEPVYTSGLSAWPITETLFLRIYDPARRPFWQVIPLGEETYQVYFTNDRARIYAIGYPMLTLFDHLVHLAEVSTLAGAAFVLVLFGTAIFTRFSRERPRVGRALLREIRASFYRKLFLAFVLASIIPVLILALVIRAYFADLLRRDIQAEAARTASVAQRVIEESDALLNRGPDGLEPLNDDVMVWISQVIDQDVNIFEGPNLVATSERDLFSSGLLPTRTPEAVYRAIVLQRFPSFVVEDQLGATPFLIAATPVRAAEREGILTVPAALRQRDIEREIDDLDRGVHLAVLCFILLGAAIGLSLAERIADPIRRLTRATQRIARGDFDARIAVRSVDELRRLVDAFNSMAGELKAQRIQLERTHRLEAWAEMARQVAHEIKNPLTPIQLSAEHLLRVHTDEGRPLGAVVEGCINTILGQVRLLRQIASEFSSFASSPQVKLGPVAVPELLAEILEPYRSGLAGRIEIRNGVSGPLPQVLVDRTLVLRALANVVENALHAMPGQGELIVSGTVEGDSLVVTVRDTGVGMDEEALARVFEPYFSTKTSGTGLGLPIARRNVELSGGSIEVESRKGQGTTVKVRLPVVPAASDSESGSTPGR
jgi:signal transduction histidine kinase